MTSPSPTTPPPPDAGRRWRWADRPLVPAVVVVIGAVAVVALRLARAAHGDPTLFVMAERPFANPALTPKGLTVLPNNGYDGQFFYRLALDPANLHTTAYGITLDTGFRLQRIGYPVLAWLLSAGQAVAVPEALIALNVAALGAIGFLGGVLARDSGRHAAWGVVMAGFFGFIFSLARDTPEPVAAALLLGALLASRRDRPVLGGLLLAGAVLTRETALIVAGAYALTRLVGALRGRVRPGRADLFWVIPAAAFAGWQLVVEVVTGALPIREDDQSNLAVPLVAMLHALRRNVGNLSASDQATDIWMAEFVVLFVVIGLAVASLRTSSARPHEKLAFVLFAVELLCLSSLNWDGLADFRSVDEVFLLGVLILFDTPRRLRVPVGMLAVVLPIVALHRTLSL